MKDLYTFAILLASTGAWSQTAAVSSKVYQWLNLSVQQEPTREHRHVLEGTTAHLEVLEIHASTVPPGKAPHGSHTHSDVDELIIVKEGRLKVTINDETKILGAGSVAMALPGDEHGFSNAGDKPVTYYILKLRSRTPMDTVRAKAAGGSFMVDRQSLTRKPGEGKTRMDYFERPTSMSRRFEMHVTTLDAGLNSHPPHTHVAEEIVLMISGQAQMQIGDNAYDITPGDVAFLGSNVSHALMNTGRERCEYFAFQWD